NQRKGDVAGVGAGAVVKAIHGDLILGSGDHLETNAAGDEDGVVVVAGHHGQPRDGEARVNAQERIERAAIREGAAVGGDSQVAVSGCGPTPPDRFAADVAGVVGFTGFFGRVGV